MNEELRSVATADSMGIYIPMSTEYLISTYGKYFKKPEQNSQGTERRTKDFYMELPLPDGQFRGYRYLATKATTVEPRLPIQNLAKLYSPNEDIWTKELSKEDLNKVDEAIALIKVSNDSAKRANSIEKMDRDIDLTDGSTINVEYVPYSEDNTGGILKDMNQHLDIAE